MLLEAAGKKKPRKRFVFRD